jgi:hypothetical protein
MERTAFISALPLSHTTVPTTDVEMNVTRYWVKGMKLILNLLIVTILATLLVGVVKVSIYGPFFMSLSSRSFGKPLSRRCCFWPSSKCSKPALPI